MVLIDGDMKRCPPFVFDPQFFITIGTFHQADEFADTIVCVNNEFAFVEFMNPGNRSGIALVGKFFATAGPREVLPAENFQGGEHDELLAWRDEALADPRGAFEGLPAILMGVSPAEMVPVVEYSWAMYGLSAELARPTDDQAPPPSSEHPGVKINVEEIDPATF